jgi:hypothetical protein
MVVLGNKYFDADEVDKAKALAVKADFNWNYEGTYLLGSILAYEKQYTASIEKFNKCWSSNKHCIDHSHIAYRIADNYYMQNKFRNAIKWCDRSRDFQAVIMKGQIAYFQRDFNLCLGWVYEMRRSHAFAAFLVAHCMITGKGWYRGDEKSVRLGKRAMQTLQRSGYMEAVDYFTGLEPVGRIVFRGCRSTLVSHTCALDMEF